MSTPRTLAHLTLANGDLRADSPRSEVRSDIVAAIGRVLAGGGGAVMDTGYSVLPIEASVDGSVYDLQWRGNKLIRCYLARTLAGSERLWNLAIQETAVIAPGLRRPDTLPWLAAAICPETATVAEGTPKEVWIALADLERCVAWAILDPVRR